MASQESEFVLSTSPRLSKTTTNHTNKSGCLFMANGQYELRELTRRRASEVSGSLRDSIKRGS